jgi:hypothetical protein
MSHDPQASLFVVHYHYYYCLYSTTISVRLRPTLQRAYCIYMRAFNRLFVGGSLVEFSAKSQEKSCCTVTAIQMACPYRFTYYNIGPCASC